jgi:hypothetical protein
MKTMAIAATVLMGAALSTAANAEMNVGPQTNGGQCWKNAKDGHNGYGYWEACPTQAAVTHHVVHHQKKKS